LKSNLENFKPRLRVGRVIPQGSRIIFETDNPYNQVILPMVLADLVLLCSGQFSVREIVEKIYKKQRAVPFKSILTAIHVLHQGGFFENGEELVLSSDLQSWMEPKRSRWNLSWRFGQRIVADKRSPTTYYAATLLVLIVSLFGMQMFPASPLMMIETWAYGVGKLEGAAVLLWASSLILSLKYVLRGWQLLLLTGKAYNVSLRLSPWGVHLHVGNEANDLFENQLYTTMFYVSQILVPWGLLFGASFFMRHADLEPFLVVAMALTFWELNPFVNSDGLRLIQSLLLSNDRDFASWHFESNQLIDSISPDQRRQNQDFTRICAIWGAIWLLFSFAMLHESAISFGPSILRRIMSYSLDSFFPLAGLLAWMAALFLVVQAFVETVAATLVRPYLRQLSGRIQRFKVKARLDWDSAAVSAKIEGLPLFSHFHEENLAKILAHSKVLEFGARATIIKEGDAARDLFVLLEGEVEVIRPGRTGNDEWMSEIGAVSVFGEAALVDDQPRAARVVSRGPVHVLKVPIQALRQAAEEAQSIRYLEDFRNAILVNQFFASSPVFRSLSSGSIDFLSSRGSLEYFDQGQLVFNQGDSGDSLYLILRGSVNVTVHGTLVKNLAQGNFFGEISLIANIPRTAEIRASEPSVFFKISSDSFWEVLVQHIDLGVFLETVSESRLREDLEIAPLPKTGSDS
jgi:CRP-like cAMP-binding protein